MQWLRCCCCSNVSVRWLEWLELRETRQIERQRDNLYLLHILNIGLVPGLVCDLHRSHQRYNFSEPVDCTDAEINLFIISHIFIVRIESRSFQFDVFFCLFVFLFVTCMRLCHAILEKNRTFFFLAVFSSENLFNVQWVSGICTAETFSIALNAPAGERKEFEGVKLLESKLTRTRYFSCCRIAIHSVVIIVRWINTLSNNWTDFLLLCEGREPNARSRLNDIFNDAPWKSLRFFMLLLGFCLVSLSGSLCHTLQPNGIDSYSIPQPNALRSVKTLRVSVANVFTFRNRSEWIIKAIVKHKRPFNFNDILSSCR